ncbi:MAG TPA: DUF4230 domain-containing protein [Candidatus Paceibacterota bacterium]|nr:DUF4230 domain-containing protein [Candidatus Paceibacterota bacterium]
MFIYTPAPLGASITDADTRRTTINWKRYLFLVLLTLFLVVAYILVTVTVSTVPRALSGAVAAVTPSPTTIEVDRLAMVRALQEKFEVTTFTMRLETTASAGTYRAEDNAWQHLWEYNRTDVVPANINAGYDWDGFKPEQVTATHEMVRVDLGPPKILSVVIDHAGVKNVSEYVGFGVGWPDTTLESKILANAEIAFRKDACTNGILKAAALSAERQVGAFLQTFLRAAGDKRTVIVTSRSPTC